MQFPNQLLICCEMTSTMFCHSAVLFQSLFLSCMITVTLVVSPSASTTNFITREFLADNKTDEDALKAFKSKVINDPQGVFRSWNDTIHFCEWEGITCGRKHRRVTILNLNSRGLSGSLSPYIGNLSFLWHLKLYNNTFQGEIPHELGRLFRLKQLFLFNNSLVGEIPTNLSYCSRLKTLSLGQNNLTGKIPSELTSLHNLKRLSLHQNNLRGGIPPFLGNFSSLETISLAENVLGGHIPYSLGRLKDLTFFEIGENNLSGIVPPSLYNLSSLDVFSVCANQLHGTLPSDLGLTLPSLNLLKLSDNFFSGPIPVSLSNASKLNTFSIARNSFSGKLKVDFGGMDRFSKLFIGYNNLGSGEVDEMDFIDSLANCSNLIYLNLPVNKFKGTLPHSIANLSSTLQEMTIGANQLYGTIPPRIANLLSLSTLDLCENQFTGPIPKEIGELKNLQSLHFESNQLSGEIPSFLGNLSLLVQLSLEDNKLSGVIPTSFGNLKQLSVLNLSQNYLNGTIPKQIFDLSYLPIELNLARNHLVGSIPRNIGNLKVTSKIDVSSNNLSGEIPNELGLCSSLEYLYMRGNSLTGSISLSLRFLKGIREIDLSRNNLSGQIPKFLETLPLEKLNLSFNKFVGEVPMKGIFANASATSVVGNGNRLCGGIVELGLSKCLNNDSKKKKNRLVSKILISIASVVFGLALLTILSTFCCLKKKREKQVSGHMLKESFLQVSFGMIHKATDGFSPTHLLGVGSFGSVYKGILEQDGTVMAIKVFNLQRQGVTKSFMAECEALKHIRHRNLVTVITCCSSIDFQGNDFKAIVYEFMANGSLERWLHPALETEEDQLKIQKLTLLQRLSIAIDVASALEYLHYHCPEQILHCDLKPSNILLDNDMTAHVGDFGLAKFLSAHVSNQNESNSTIGIRGTIGYAAPEYGQGSKVSTYGDVYSYGILLLEMVTRKNPTNHMFEGDFNLHNFGRMALPDRIIDILDPLLVKEEVAAPNHRMRQQINKCRNECMISMVRIGVACSMESPQDRMNIREVVHELQKVRMSFNKLQQPSKFNRQGGQ